LSNLDLCLAGCCSVLFIDDGLSEVAPGFDSYDYSDNEVLRVITQVL